MKNPIHFIFILSFTTACMSCSADLPTDNKNLDEENDLLENILDPNLATDEDTEALIVSSFLTWFDAIESGPPNMSLAVMSDAYTCSWGNYGMSFLSQEPRVEFENTTTFGNRSVIENPWFGLYSAISAANDGIRRIESGTVTLGADNERALAFGHFVQGLSHGWLALNFDQAFILNEDVDLATANLEFKPYPEVMDAAIVQLEECIDICNANTFTLPADWINGRSFTNAELAQVAHSFIARYMAALPRNTADRTNVDWNKVISHINQGITQTFGVTGNGGGRGDPWWNSVQWYSAENNTWQRVDYRTIGPSDPGNQYTDWSSFALADRDEFVFPSTDLRVWDGTVDENGDQNAGLYIDQKDNTMYAAGNYHRSRYGHEVFYDYRYVTATASESPLLRVNEHDFLRAEALLHLGGSTAEIAALLDKTHVTNGGYPSTAGLAVGTINDDPQPQHNPTNGTQPATLWSVLKYEKIIEILGVFPGLEFYEKRGWGDLTSLTLIHFPVPAKTLQFLLLPYYTFGGGGDGSAP